MFIELNCQVLLNSSASVETAMKNAGFASMLGKPHETDSSFVIN